MRAQPDNSSFWQGYADLAMGLMAVFVVILILLLAKQNEQSEDLKAEREQFAQELMQILEAAGTIVKNQDEAESLLRNVFEQEGCNLRLTEKGTLEFDGVGAEQTELYRKNEYALSREAQRALKSCADQFTSLARCLTPASEAREECIARLKADRDAVKALEGLEAIVLRGSTDRTSGNGRDQIASHEGFPHRTELSESYVKNADLGAERARQALGHLVYSVADEDVEPKEHSAQRVLMSRLRIESPSFGLYQVGPREKGWRTAGCEDDSDDCASARNLSMQVRWKSAALRGPYDEIRKSLCGKFRNPESALRKGLSDASEADQAKYEALCNGVSDE